MHGPASAAFAPALALISQPSYLSLAIIGAIAVVVYEIRGLLRRLFAVSAVSASRRRAKRAPLRMVVAPDLDTALPDEDRSASGSPPPKIVVNAIAAPQSSEREPMAEAPPAFLRKEIATPQEPASISCPSNAPVREGKVTEIERDAPGESVTAADSATSHSRPGGARDVRVVDGRRLELRTMSRRDRVRLLAFAQRLPARARIALAVDLNNAATLDTWAVDVEAADTRTIVAYEDASIVGYASLRRGAAPWTRHVGEICIVVGGTRQDAGVGDCLAREMVAQALDAGLQKITARTIDDAATRAIFEQVGFSAEALLSDHLIDEEQRTLDVLIMSATRDQLVDMVPRELRVIASGQSATDARDAEDAPPKERPLVVRAAGVAYARSSQVVHAERAIVVSGHGEISRRLEDAPVAEPSLVAVPAGDAPDTSPSLDAEESTASRVRAALTPVPTRPRPMRRAYLIAAMVGAMLVVAFVGIGIYVTNGHTSPTKLEVLGASARPTLPATFAPGPAFESTHAGSGGVFLAVVRPATTVRVSIDPDVVGTWFWCFESSFGLPLAEHYCAGGSTSEPRSAELVTQGAIRIDPAWSADAMYFVQMYCDGPCVWHVQVLPQ